MSITRTTIYWFSGRCSKCEQTFDLVSVSPVGASPECVECEYKLNRKKDAPRTSKTGNRIWPVAQMGEIPRLRA